MRKEQLLAQTKRELEAMGEYKVRIIEIFLSSKVNQKQKLIVDHSRATKQ